MNKSFFDDPLLFFHKDRYDHRKRKYFLGIFYIVLVSAIWVASSVFSQFLYTERSFDSPFLVTYLGICLFSFILPTKWICDKIGWTTDTTCLSSSLVCGNPNDEFSVTTQYEDDLYRKSMINRKQRREKKREKLRRKIMELRSSILKGKKVPKSNNDGIEHVSTNEILESRTINMGGNDILSVSSHYSDSVSATFDLNHKGPHWNHSKHIFVAMHIAPVLFLANWLFNASLQGTSVTSSTVLVSTSGIFVFVLAVLVRDESFHWLKLVGALMGILGSLLTARHDSDIQDGYIADPYYEDVEYDCLVQNCNSHVWGDTLAVLAAASFGVYAVQVRLLCPVDEELYSMGLLLGYIGVLTMIPLLPVAAIRALNIGMTWEVFILVVVRGLFDYVISEYLHFRAVILTNATIATVGLGLTIPMAFAVDIARTNNHQNIVDVQSLLGALAVSAGFIVVNIVNDSNNNDRDTSAAAAKTQSSVDPVLFHSAEFEGNLFEKGVPKAIIQQKKQLTPILETDN